MNEPIPSTTETGLGSGDGAQPPREATPSESPPDLAALMGDALTWVEQNQTLAMLGAFALGVFIGTMMRD